MSAKNCHFSTKFVVFSCKIDLKMPNPAPKSLSAPHRSHQLQAVTGKL
jgi:hypothetical protein